MTADLVAFLRARLDEDSFAATGTLDPVLQVGIHRGKSVPRWMLTPGGGIVDTNGTVRVRFPYEAEAAHIVRHDPARVLAEVDAKRRILDECGWAVKNGGGSAFVLPVLRLLALPYRQHPDYQPDWAPEA